MSVPIATRQAHLQMHSPGVMLALQLPLHTATGTPITTTLVLWTKQKKSQFLETSTSPSNGKVHMDVYVKPFPATAFWEQTTGGCGSNEDSFWT